MGTFVSDTFTDTDNTTLGNHTGETGATWTEHTSYATADPIITDANRLRPNGSTTACWYASGTPASADYDVIVGITQRSQAASNNTRAAGRIDTSSNTLYMAGYTGATTGWQLYRIVNGTATQLGTTQSATLTADQRYECKLSMSGSTIKLLVDGVELISVTDTNITAAGMAGIRGVGAGVDNTGLHWDDLVATEADAGGAVALVGTASASAAAEATLALRLALEGSAAATGGAAAALSLGLALTGAAGATAGATGTFSCVLALTGQADAVAGAVGVLELLGGVSLSGVASATSGASGTLSLRVGLSGTASAIAGAVGTLQRTGLAVSFVWASRGESAGWEVTGEWYDPAAASPTATTPTDGETLH